MTLYSRLQAGIARCHSPVCYKTRQLIVIFPRCVPVAGRGTVVEILEHITDIMSEKFQIENVNQKEWAVLSPRRFNGLYVLASHMLCLMAFACLRFQLVAQPLSLWSPITNLTSMTKLDDGRYIGIGGVGVFRSSNQGRDWTRLNYPSNGRNGQGVGFAVVAGGGLLFVSSIDDGIWLSRDGGDSWAPTGPVRGSFGTGSPSIAFNGSDFIAGYGGWPRGVYRWDGSAWLQKLSNGKDGNSVIALPNGRFLVGMFDGGGTYSSDDGGNSWVLRSDASLYLCQADGVIYGFDSESQVRRSLDTGNTWSLWGKPTNAYPQFNGGLTASRNNQLLVGSYGSGLWSTTDGTVWLRLSTNSAHANPVVIDTKLFVCSAEGLFVLNEPTFPRVATAVPQIINGFIVGIEIADGGSGYTNAPNITFIDPSGSGASAQAFISNGIVRNISILSPGHAYSPETRILIDEPPFPPVQAKGLATWMNGSVISVTLTDGGHGYGDAPPPVYFLGGGGSGATGFASVSNGIVTGITMTHGGGGYTAAPKVLIAAPPGYPSLSVAISQVRVAMTLPVGYNYQLQATTDMGKFWSNIGSPFLATNSPVTEILDVTLDQQLFRVVQTP